MVRFNQFRLFFFSLKLGSTDQNIILPEKLPNFEITKSFRYVSGKVSNMDEVSGMNRPNISPGEGFIIGSFVLKERLNSFPPFNSW